MYNLYIKFGKKHYLKEKRYLEILFPFCFRFRVGATSKGRVKVFQRQITTSNFIYEGIFSLLELKTFVISFVHGSNGHCNLNFLISASVHIDSCHFVSALKSCDEDKTICTTSEVCEAQSNCASAAKCSYRRSCIRCSSVLFLQHVLQPLLVTPPAQCSQNSASRGPAEETRCVMRIVRELFDLFLARRQSSAKILGCFVQQSPKISNATAIPIETHFALTCKYPDDYVT